MNKTQIETKDKMKITKDEYLAYENVRESGVYNMFDSRAIALSGLHKERYIEIMKRYDELTKRFS